MENNLRKFREKSLLTPKQLSRLLNISVHTYIAMEQDKCSISTETIIMISKIYKIPSRFLFENLEKNEQEIDQAMEVFAKLEENDRFILAMKNLTNDEVGKSIYRQIRKVKMQIYDEINKDK